MGRGEIGRHDYLLAIVLGSAAFLTVVAGIVYVFKRAIVDRLKLTLKHDFDDKLAIQQDVFERYRNKLQQDHELALERLRGELRVDAFRNETRFSRLHADRANAISKIYAALKKARAAIAHYVTDLEFANTQPFEVRRKEAWGKLQALEDLFNPLEIFVPAAIAEKIREYIRSSTRDLRDFKNNVEDRIKTRNENDEVWQKIIANVSGPTKQIFEDLRSEFRRLLGDDAPPATDADEAN